MSSEKFERRASLLAGVSFADVWRAARYHQLGGHGEHPSSLEIAHASRFAAPGQPFASEASVAGEPGRAADIRRYRQAA
ncbi:hypothetical protein RLW55_18295 [Hyphomicrobium sp. B1]|uniref:hypothetical protein n=1 Tax=Hyphomicrobium sp. B1 TaxID=3075651 RepID=UPI003C2F9D4E